jgi:integrase
VTRGQISRPPPGDLSLLNYAHWLANFLEWADVRKVDVFTCEYGVHVQGRYQNEMLLGSWSRDGEPLSAQTINLRVQQACDYLSWLGDKGKRASFDVPIELRTVRTGGATSTKAHERKQVAVRKGKVRKNKKKLRMPTDEQLRAWLERVYAHAGKTQGLRCETVLLSAMRREEVGCLRVDTLPEDPKTWHLSNPDAPYQEQRVLIDIKFGTKGQGYGKDHGDKIGPERSIWIPLELAEKLHRYRLNERAKALRIYVGKAKTLAEKRKRIADSVHLFLDETTGERLKARTLYDAWRSVELPFVGWCPHLGRDWWACSVLLRELKRHEHISALGPGISAALLESTAMSIIRLQIQPQLGHAQDSTTMIYLEWVADMLGVNLSIRYEQSLEEEQ